MTAALLCGCILSAAALSYCDVNLDDAITAADARSILRAAVGLEHFAAEQIDIADVNRDGKVTAADARAALRMAVGLDAEIPYTKAETIGRVLFSGGAGTKQSPYLIATAEQFRAIYRFPAAHYMQTADIDFNNNEIPEAFNDKKPFSGSYNGNGKKLMRIITGSAIFGYVAESGVLEKIVMENCGSTFGALLATYNHGTLRNCRISGVSDCTNDATYSTGLLVNVNTGTIINCSAEGTVNGKTTAENAQTQIGGIAGQNAGTISGCRAVVNVKGASSSAKPGAILLGGIAAWNEAAGHVDNCEAAGDIGFGTYIGGIVGYNQGTIANCIYSGSSSVPAVGNNTGTVE